MAKVVKAKEISVKMKNEPGAGAAIFAALADAKVNLISACGYGEKGNAVMMFVCADYAKAKMALKKAKFKSTAVDVILVDLNNKAGAMAAVTEKLAAKNIDIEYAYATTCGRNAMAVFRVAGGPARAIKALS